MTYNIYIKGVAEDYTPPVCAAAFLVIDESGNEIAHHRGNSQLMSKSAIHKTKASLCMEIWAAASAINIIPEGSSVHFYTNATTVRSWIKTMHPLEGDYKSYWDTFARMLHDHNIKSVDADYIPKEDSPELQHLKKYALYGKW